MTRTHTHTHTYTHTHTHTHTHTLGRTHLDKGSARRRHLPADTQYSQETVNHAPEGMQARNSSKRSSADPLLKTARPPGSVKSKFWWFILLSVLVVVDASFTFPIRPNSLGWLKH